MLKSNKNHIASEVSVENLKSGTFRIRGELKIFEHFDTSLFQFFNMESLSCQFNMFSLSSYSYGLLLLLYCFVHMSWGLLKFDYFIRMSTSSEYL